MLALYSLDKPSMLAIGVATAVAAFAFVYVLVYF